MSAHGFARLSREMLMRLFLAAVVLTLVGPPARTAPPVSRWGANYFPNVPLLTQDNEKVRFYDDLIKNKVVVISFIFTHCADSCPAETASLRRVQKLLGDSMGQKVFFYSISIDPEHDTPQALKEYARKFKTGPGWTFLTGDKADIVLLQKKLGLYREEDQAKNLSDHHISIIVGNEATGQWMKRSPFDHPKVLARLLGVTLQNSGNAKPGQLSYAQAPRLPKLSKGEDLFRSRCLSCHSMGSEDGLGPGLKGVTEHRDRTWLARWLKAPEVLLAEKDPIATQLFDKYNQLPMPNLKLSDSDVEALIDFMAAPDSRPQQPE